MNTDREDEEQRRSVIAIESQAAHRK